LVLSTFLCEFLIGQFFGKRQVVWDLISSAIPFLEGLPAHDPVKEVSICKWH
jgi:hypothetical protein